MKMYLRKGRRDRGGRNKDKSEKQKEPQGQRRRRGKRCSSTVFSLKSFVETTEDQQEGRNNRENEERALKTTIAILLQRSIASACNFSLLAFK